MVQLYNKNSEMMLQVKLRAESSSGILSEHNWDVLEEELYK